MIFILFGPPGAGKGTQASLIAQSLNIPHLSTGEILRKKILDTDPLALKLREIIDSGNLVSDNILNEIIANRLVENDCSLGFILDGYPRTVAQKDFLEIFLKNNDLFVSQIFELKVDQKTIIDRIKSRSNIENRQDDKEEIIKTRISKYSEETRPVFEFYNSNYSKNYNVINGNQEIKMIHQDILKIAKNKDFQQ